MNPHGFQVGKPESRETVSAERGDRPIRVSHHETMECSQSGPHWFLREWMAHFEKRQTDMCEELGWLKPRASKVYNSRSYRRETVNELSAWLGIEPFELLMHPRDALALRRLRETAAQIVQDAKPEPPVAARERRNGTTG